MQENKTHINNLKAYAKSKQPVIWIQILHTKQYTSALFCTSTQSIVYLNNILQAESITKDVLLNEKNILQHCAITKSVIGVCDEKFVVLPNVINEPFAQKNALAMVHDVLPNELIYADSIAWQKMQLTYALKAETLDVLKNLHTDLHIANSHTSLLYCALNTKQKNAESMFVHFATNSICITVLKNNALQLHNSYGIEDAKDALYYILKTKNQMQITKAVVHVSGINAIENVADLSAVIANVKLAAMPSGILNTDLQEAEAQHFYNLYCLINQCV